MLQQAQERMKSMADKGRYEQSFEVKDDVLVKLKRYKQVFLAQCHSNKFERRFFGPYKVLAKIGNVTYQIQLPASVKS